MTVRKIDLGGSEKEANLIWTRKHSFPGNDSSLGMRLLFGWPSAKGIRAEKWDKTSPDNNLELPNKLLLIKTTS